MIPRTFLIISIPLFFAFCQKNGSNSFAKIDNRTITQSSFEAFRTMKSNYPASVEGFFPGTRSDQTVCLETELLFQEAGTFRTEVEKSADWKWKQRFFPSQQYIEKILDRNWGFSNAEIDAYYNKNKAKYKNVIKVPITTSKTDSLNKQSEAKSGKDSTASGSKDSASTALKDSVYFLTKDEARGQVARELFLVKYPPDAAFIKKNTDSLKSLDTSLITNRWVSEFRKDFPTFFMKKQFEKKYNKKYPDSLDGIFGKDKLITPQDYDVIIKWVPESNRGYYQNPEKQRYLVEWLLKWLLFSEDAKKFPEIVKENQPSVEWALKFDVALRYSEEKLVKQFKPKITIDTQLCYYKLWDNNGKPGLIPDTNELNAQIKTDKDTKLQISLDSVIYQLRIKHKIAYLQTDLVDNLVLDPIKVAAKADSLYSAGNTDQAQVQYQILVENFPFLPQGKNVMIERAKILTEKENYNEAVSLYRKYLLISDAKERRCNVYFMVGFIYGEYLGRPDVAEVNYKWILKNAPSCELAEDAEFMIQHLDEPILDIEGLKAESKRQGKNPDAKE